MSATKAWLADQSNYSRDTLRGLSHQDPEVRRLVGGIIVRERMKLASGFSMSVQYSRGHYCNGREKIMGGEMESANDPYPEPKSVEVGFPTQAEPLLTPYAEEAWRSPLPLGWLWKQPRWVRRLLGWIKLPNHTGTVYGWVPIEVVDAVINKHGGIVE